MRIINCAVALLVSSILFAEEQVSSPAQILEKSPATDWRTVEAERTLYLELPQGRVVIELATSFAPNHVKNIKALLEQRYFDGSSILRSQDNFVVQWGWPEGQAPKLKSAKAKLDAEWERPIHKDFVALEDPDTYVPRTGFIDGFPAAQDPKLGKEWLTHCYGMVGVGRDNEADSGNASELYVVTGHAPRRLDRNVTLVGRVIQGIELLSAMPRGTGDMGFYKTDAERTKIKSIRLGSELPKGERLNLEALKTESQTFKTLIDKARFRKDAWYKNSPEHIDVCSVLLPVRIKV